MKKIYLFAVIVVAAAIVGWLVISRTSPSPNNTSAPSSGQKAAAEKAPNFGLQDYKGKTIKLSDFAGKPLVINSWAAWCPFCRKELPDFSTVQKEFGDKVVIIAIDRAETLDTAKKYSDQLGVTNDIVFLLDPGDSFYQSISGFSMPETIFVDKNGVIAEHKRGPMEVGEMREKIQRLIAP